MNVAVYKNLPFVATIPCFVRNIILFLPAFDRREYLLGNIVVG